MERKEIQEQRMKSYFIQATKEILKGEGLKAISVRNIAERAGYSYATLYNYFKDINELIFICVKDFQDECENFIKEETADIPIGKPKIKLIAQKYIQYFTQYPGIFELFFIEKIIGLGNKQETTMLIYSFLDRLYEADWKYCIENKIFTEQESYILKSELNFGITGMLLFYLNRRQPADYKEFIKTIHSQLDKILQIENL